MTNNMKKMALNEAVNEVKLNAERIENRLYDMMYTVVGISNVFYSDRELEKIISKKYVNSKQLVNDQLNYKWFDGYLASYKEVVKIKVYVENETFFDTGNIIRANEQIVKSSWYKKAVKCKGAVNWEYIYDRYDHTDYFCLTRMIGNFSSKAKAVLVICIDPHFLQSIVEKKKFEIMIVNDKDIIIASTEKKNLNLNIKNFYNFKIENSKKLNSIVYKNQQSKIIFKKINLLKSDKNLRILSIFPIDKILEPSKTISELGLSIIGISLVLALILIFIFSDILSRRIKVISKEMHKVATGDFDIKSQITGSDEMGQLASDLNIMVESIRKLINEAYIANLQKQQLIIKQKEIKFQMLANQINPHFLFNALEAIRMKAVCCRQKEIANVVQLLGKFLRKNLQMQDELVELKYEIELTMIYYKIQKFRFGEKICYNINIPENILDYKILPLTIEPIVENAIVHGLENKEDIGLVIINAEENEYNLIITIKDNGIGIDKQKLTEIVNSLKKDDEIKKRIGIKNVYQRIKLYCGEDYGLKIDSEIGKGTVVKLFLPKGGLKDVKSTYSR